MSRLDDLLGGGFVSGEVVEVGGVSGAGKTWLCARLAAAVAASGRRVLYMDTAAALTPAVVAGQLTDIGAEVRFCNS